jgi:hypothetical protein
MKRKLVYVEWDDSGCESGWLPAGGVVNKAVRCRSVGWVIGRNDNAITLGSHISEYDQVSEPMTIPLVAVTRIRRVADPTQTIRKAPRKSRKARK